MKLNGSVLAIFQVLTIVSLSIGLSVGLIGCSSPKPAQQEQPPSRYALTGRVVSVDKATQKVTVDAKEIPGFMSAMTMAYSVKNPALLEPLAPEDQITADVLVNAGDVWLENIVVVKKPDQANSPGPSKTPKPPAKGQ
jgi:Cu/Ag efflux protein CusF